MTNSATSTERDAAARVRPAAAKPADAQQGFRPWHFFILLSMAGATVAVMLSVHTHPVALLLLSAAVVCAGVVGLTLHRAIEGFFQRGGEPLPLPAGTYEDLLREKALVLRSIKELEFDKAMGKVSEADFTEISSRLRARALSLMADLDRAPVAPAAKRPSAPAPAPVAAVTARSCAGCGTVNDTDARFCKNCGSGLGGIEVSRCGRANLWLCTVAALVVGVVAGPVAHAQVAMPNPKEMSGNVLPVNDIPAGTVTVRVVRGAFKNIPGQPVDFLIAGKKRTVVTDANGRAEVSGLARGTQLIAEATVDGEKLVSKPAVVESSGLRIILVATDSEDVARAAEDKALAAAPPVKGIVVLGPESRVITQMSNDRLHIYYVLDIINTARTPVDIGGPLVFDLPREARGAVVLEGSSPQAVAAGPRVRVTGPFAPGSTHVEAAYELPYTGGVAVVNQTWPAALDRVTLLVPQIGGLTVKSPQVASLRSTTDRGQEVLVGTGPGLAAGQSLSIEIAGLPHRATWPRTLALTLASIIVAAGVWGAVTARPRYRVA